MRLISAAVTSDTIYHTARLQWRIKEIESFNLETFSVSRFAGLRRGLRQSGTVLLVYPALIPQRAQRASETCRAIITRPAVAGLDMKASILVFKHSNVRSRPNGDEKYLQIPRAAAEPILGPIWADEGNAAKFTTFRMANSQVTKFSEKSTKEHKRESSHYEHARGGGRVILQLRCVVTLCPTGLGLDCHPWVTKRDARVTQASPKGHAWVELGNAFVLQQKLEKRPGANPSARAW